MKDKHIGKNKLRESNGWEITTFATILAPLTTG
jgi:hypothetical protein